MRADHVYDVCIITTIHPDFDNRIYQRQANALIDAGLSVCIVAPWQFENRSRTDFEYVATAYPERRLDRIRHGWQTYRAVSKVRAKIYIFHDNDFLPWGLLLKRRLNCAVVYDAHENIPEDILYGKDWIPRPLRGLTSWAFRRVENFVVRSLRETMVSVPHLKSRFEALGARAILVRNFANFDVPPDFSNAEGILYTGDLTRDYGVENLLSLAREISKRGVRIPFRVVDRFRDDDKMRQYFKRVVESEKLKVELLAPVPAERMPEILAMGTIGLSPIPDLPNKRLALPTKLFEYFAFGLVALASDIDGTRDVTDGGRLGLLLPDKDMTVWADAIERLIADPKLAESYRVKARAASNELYTWSGERARMIDYVKTLLDGTP